MKQITLLSRLLFCVISLGSCGGLFAQEAAPSAKELAAQLSSAVLDGSSVVRVKLEGGQPDPVVQLQIKSRRTAAGTDLLYQVLWPKERKGGGFVMRKASSGSITGSVSVPPGNASPLTAAGLDQPVFGSALHYADLVENFFAWNEQTVAGQETVDRVPCVILESKPGSGDRSVYSRVRSWVDAKRLVTLRVEKYNRAGQMVCRIVTTRVAKNDTRRHVAASFTVQRAGQPALTTLEGSNSKHDVTLPDSDFTADALRTLTK